MVTPTVEGTTGVAEVRTFVTGNGGVKVTVSDADGRKVAEGSDKAPCSFPTSGCGTGASTRTSTLSKRS